MNKTAFIEAYNNPQNTVDDVKKAFGLNNHQYNKLYKELNLGKRKVEYTNAKHKSKLSNGNIIVRKWINGKKEYLGVYKNDEDADKVINTCNKHNWDINNPNVQAVIHEYRLRNKNYCKINNRYYVYKNFKGKRIYYDSFKCEADAISCTALLDLIEWNKEAYDNIKVII